MRINLTPNMAGVLQTCPFSFQEKYLTKTVLKPALTCCPASRLSQNVHGVLDVFYTRGGHVNFSESALLDLLNQKWNSDGFSSIEEELAYKQEASRQVRNYYAASIHESTCQLRLAQTFHAITTPVILGHHKITMSGRFDRLDLFEDSSLEVVNYKTGSSRSGLPDRQEFAGRLTNLIYFRLARDLFPDVQMITVSNYYLRSLRKISVSFTPEIIENSRTELEILLDELEVGLAPTLVSMNCARCLVREAGKCHQFDQSESLFAEVIF